MKEVQLLLSPSQGNYIKTQHLHATQKIISDDASGVVITIRIIPNYELLQTLLAFGPEVKVLEPSLVREQMKVMAEKTFGLYK